MKTLDNYFDDWVFVSPPITTAVVIDNWNLWCEQHVGIKGLNWQSRWVKVAGGITRNIKEKWCYLFKKEEHAMLFLLTWGGEIITRSVAKPWLEEKK